MNNRIILDCERMKYPFTGLYYFCSELGQALIQQNATDEKRKIGFYVPEKVNGFFGTSQEYFIQKNLHKFFPKNFPQYNLWHCTYQGSNYIPQKRKGIKILTTVHDLNFLYESKSPAKKNNYKQRIQHILNRSDIIVTISDFVKQDIINLLATDGKRIEVIYNGCNKPGQKLLKKPSIPIKDSFFFTIGTVNAKKNFHVLPAMLKGNNHELLIAGKIESLSYKTQIESIAKELGVEERVKFLGTIDDAEKFWLQKHCSAFCFPSIAEGFGLPVVEAMQFGTPVILSKATSLPEIGGKEAFYFEKFCTESVSKTANDFLSLEISAQTKDKLIARAALFDWEQSAKKYLNLYDEMLAP